MHYKLDGDQVQLVEDLMEWAEWMEKNDRRIARTQVGEADVSTVFLGINHRWDNGPPLLFETMIFGGKLDQEQWRYSTRDEAIAGHAYVVQLTAAADGT